MLYPIVRSPDESEVGKWRQQKNFIYSIRSDRFHVLTPFSTGNDALCGLIIPRNVFSISKLVKIDHLLCKIKESFCTICGKIEKNHYCYYF